MRYLALAADFDGTLAHDGRVADATLKGLERLRQSGRRLLMVTGRELPDLRAIFDHFDLFDRIVAENGAVVYRPATHEEKILAEPPPPAFVAALRKRGVGPISVGRVIVATWEPHQSAVLETIRDLGLELQVIFNKGAVMVLPSGVNKATGLNAALDEMGLSAHNIAAIGDAENDHAFLTLCELSAAVSNALPALKEKADLVTSNDHGAGVVELIDRMVKDDLADLAPRLKRHSILLGQRADGTEDRIAPFGRNVLVAGSSGSGKSTLTTGILERLAEAGYQFVVIDPEGDYSNLEGAAVLGDPQRPPLLEEILDLLKPRGQNAVVNLLGVALEQRPAFFEALLPRLQALRMQTARPHWIVVDEAHHLMHAGRTPAEEALPRQLGCTLLITVHPGSVSRPVLESVDLLLAVGEAPERTIKEFSGAVGMTPPPLEPTQLATGEVLAWRPHSKDKPMMIRTEPPRTERRRHSRKYAEGNLGADRSFYFRGPKGLMNLRAQNLVIFVQLAEGVDDETWVYHLQRNEYSEWFRDAIKDEGLADAVRDVEGMADLTPRESRDAIREAIVSRYTLPVDRPSGHYT